MTKKNRTTIEITQSVIKIVQTRKIRGKEVVAFCDVKKVISQKDVDIIQALHSMVSSLPANPDELIMIVPRKCVILRQMVFPTDNPVELEDMIGLQLINNIPYPVEDVIYQYEVLDKNEQECHKVLVTVIHKDVSQKYYSLLQMAGVKSGKLVLSSLSICHGINQQRHRKNSEKLNPIILFNLDADQSEICFCGGDRLYFSRSFGYGSKHISAGHVTDLASQIKSSSEAYDREQWGPKGSQLLILSGQKEGVILKDKLEEVFDIQIKVLRSLGDVNCLPDVRERIVLLKEKISLTANIWLSFVGTNNLSSLAPTFVKEERNSRRKKQQVIKFACLFCIVCVLGWASQFIGVTQKQVLLNDLKDKISKQAIQLKEARNQIKIVQFFEEKDARNQFIPDLIDELSRMTPEEVSLKTLSLNKTGSLTMLGYAQTNAHVNSFQGRMIQSSHFHDVVLESSTKRRIANKSMMDFKIVSYLGRDRNNSL